MNEDVSIATAHSHLVFFIQADPSFCITGTQVVLRGVLEVSFRPRTDTQFEARGCEPRIYLVLYFSSFADVLLEPADVGLQGCRSQRVSVAGV